MSAAGLPLTSPCMDVELHTATKIYRLRRPFWILRGLYNPDTMQPQAAETIVATINRHLSKQRTTAAPNEQQPAASDGSALNGADEETVASVYTPLLHQDRADALGDAGEVLALGKPLETLKHMQAQAVRSTNFRLGDGAWISTAVPPRASAHIQILTRGPGELRMLLPWPTTIYGAAETVVLCIAACAVAFTPSVLVAADSGGPAWGEFILQFAVYYFGGVCVVLALAVKRHSALLVTLDAERFRAVLVPWWLSVDMAAALSPWLPLLVVARGVLEDLAGAQVCAWMPCIVIQGMHD